MIKHFSAVLAYTLSVVMLASCSGQNSLTGVTTNPQVNKDTTDNKILPSGNNKFSLKGITSFQEGTLTYTAGSWNTVTDAGASGGTYGVGTTVNTVNEEQDITTSYTGQWPTITDANANGGSYSLNNGGVANITENNSGGVYSPGWATANTGNASGGSFSYNFGYQIPLEENSGDVVYSGSNWVNNGVLAGKGFSFSDVYIGATKVAYTEPTYNGSWTDLGTYYSADGLSGQSFDVNFTGTNFYGYCLGGPDKGIVTVKLYDALNNIVKQYDLDLYSPSTLVKYVSFIGVAKGNYRVNVTATGTKNVASTAYSTNFWRAFIFPSVEYYFYGTEIKYYATKYSRGGKVYVTLDGDNSKTSQINLYAAPSGQYPYGYHEMVKQYTALSPGKHRITIDGTPWFDDPGKTYNVMTLERFDVMPYIKGSFTGSDFALNTVKAASYGKMDLYIDDVFNQTVDLYSPTAVYNNNIIVNGLSNTSHTYVLVGRREKNTSSSGYIIDIDSTGSGAPSFTKTFSGISATIYANKGPNFGIVNLIADGSFVNTVDLYSPTLQYNQPVANVYFPGDPSSHTVKLEQTFTKNASSSGYKFSFDSSSSGAELPSVNKTFTGTGIEYIATKESNGGNVEIFVDSVSQGVFDLYSATNSYQQSIFSLNNLTNGSHNIEIRSKNTKNASSSGYGINIDGINVTDTSLGGGIGND